jgi:hypothetical protein
LCKEGRVPGVELVGNRWFFPVDAVKPENPRKAGKSGCRITKSIASGSKIRSSYETGNYR